MRGIVVLSVILAVAAGALSTHVSQGTPHNFLPWVPVVMAAVPLVAPTNVWVYVVAAVWLLAFSVLGGFSIGIFYLPAAVLMLGASLGIMARGPARNLPIPELKPILKVIIWASFGVTVAVSAGWSLYLLHRRGTPAAYWFLLAPIVSASLPLWWRKEESVGIAAALLAASALFPITISIGMWYSPACILMLYAAIVLTQSNRGSRPEPNP